MKELLSKILLWQPRKVFLADALGACFTSTLLGLVLIHFHELFGLSREVFRYLSLLVVPYAIYSFSMYFLNLTNWRVYLKTIALANLAYCIITTAVLIRYYQTITALGIAYFLGEAMLICSIACFEWKYAVEKGKG